MVSQSVIKTVNAVTDAYMYTFTWKDPRVPLSHVDVFRRDNIIKKDVGLNSMIKRRGLLHLFQFQNTPFSKIINQEYMVSPTKSTDAKSNNSKSKSNQILH